MGTTRMKKDARGLVLALAALLLAALLAALAPSPAAAKTTSPVTSGCSWATDWVEDGHVLETDSVADQETYLELSTVTLVSVDYADTNGKTKEDLVTTQNWDENEAGEAICVPVTNTSNKKTGGGTYEDIVLEFEKVGTLDGELLDVTLTITEAELGPVRDTSAQEVRNSSFQNGASSGWASLVEVYDDHIEFGGSYLSMNEMEGLEVDEDGDVAAEHKECSSYVYIGEITLDYEVEVTYHDDGGEVEGNFYQVVSDLDSYAYETDDDDAIAETIRFVSGFEEYYVYDDCLLCTDGGTEDEGPNFRPDNWNLGTNDETDGGQYYKSRSAWKAGSYTKSVADCEYLVAGVIATTTSSTTTARWNAGGCSTAFKLYLQGDGDREVEKTVAEDDEECSYGDEVEWTVTFDMPERYVDWFSDSTIESLVVTDTLPEGFEYVTNSVKLTYTDDSGTRTLGKHTSEDDFDGDEFYYAFTYSSKAGPLKVTINPNWLADIDNYTGGTFTLTFSTLVTDDAALGTNTNEVVASYGGAEYAATAKTTLSQPKLTIQKTVYQDEYLPGDTMTWTVTVRNTGNKTATDVVIEDELPDGLTLSATPSVSTTSGTGGAVVSAKVSSGSVGADSWRVTASSMPAGSTIKVTFYTEAPDVDEDSDYTNVATAAADDVDEVEAARTTTVLADDGLVLTKSCSASSWDVGDEITWTVYVENSYENTYLYGVVLEDEIPDGLEFSGFDYIYSVDGDYEGTGLAGSSDWWGYYRNIIADDDVDHVTDEESPQTCYPVTYSSSKDKWTIELTALRPQTVSGGGGNYDDGYNNVTHLWIRFTTTATEASEGQTVVNTVTATTETGPSAEASARTTVNERPGSLTVSKAVEGTELSDQSFTAVVELDGVEQEVVLDSSNGWSCTFEDVEAGTTYKVTEEDLPSGYELASISPSSGTVGANEDVAVTITNSYDATGAWEPFADGTATKLLTGNRDIVAGEFAFAVTEDGSVVSTGTTDGAACEDGLASAAIDFSSVEYGLEDVGVHTYSVFEQTVDPEGSPGVEGDDAAFTVEVTVSDNGDGTLATSVEVYDEDGQAVSDGAVSFTNSYIASGSWTPSASKTLDGGTDDLGYYDFAFELADEDGTVLRTARCADDGSVSFKAIEYDQDDIGSTFVYTLSEVDGGDGDIDYDGAVYTAKVAVSDDGDGTLTATALWYDEDGNAIDGAPAFENAYDGHDTLLPSAGLIGGIAAVAGGLALVGAGTAMRLRNDGGSGRKRPSVRR